MTGGHLVILAPQSPSGCSAPRLTLGHRRRFYRAEIDEMLETPVLRVERYTISIRPESGVEVFRQGSGSKTHE